MTPLGHCHPQWVLVSFLYPHVIIVQTPTKLRIISLEKSGKNEVFQTKSRKDFRPQKALSNIPDSARPPLGTGILRFLVLACLLAWSKSTSHSWREKKGHCQAEWISLWKPQGPLKYPKIRWASSRHWNYMILVVCVLPWVLEHNWLSCPFLTCHRSIWACHIGHNQQ